MNADHLRHSAARLWSRWRHSIRAAVCGAVMGVVLVGCSAGPGPTAGSAEVVPSLSAPCQSAVTLAKGGFPQRAIALIDGFNEVLAADATKSCLPERASAWVTVQQAQKLALESQALASSDSKQAQAKASEALKLDQENALAATVATTEPNPACESARSLVSSAFPQRAIALINQLNSQAAAAAAKQCTSNYMLAAAAIETAQRHALDAQSLTSTNLPEARSRALIALQIDRENALAKEIAARLDPTWWQVTAKNWSDFVEHNVTPISGLLLPALTLAGTLLLFARLLVFVVPLGTRKTRAQSSEAGLGVGVLLTLGASVAFIGALTASGEGLFALQLPGAVDTRVWAASFCLLGAALTGWGLATRLRIGVVARKGTAEDDAGAAHVLALLDDLGASPPKGLEKPQGADAQGLANAIDSAPDNPVGKVLKSIVGAITGWQPWQVRVDQEEGGTVSVAVSRNGRTKGGAVIDLKALELASIGTATASKLEKVDPHRFAAAVVLTTLNKYHRGFEGLCGTTDWQSLGLHYIATTDFKTDDNAAKELLAIAVDRDPDNWLAQVALASLKWRKATDLPELERYEEWLKAALRRMTDLKKKRAKPGYETLRLRTQSTLAAVTINHAYKSSNGGQPDLTDARSEIAALCVDLYSAKGKEVDPAWLATSRAVCAARALLLDLGPGASLKGALSARLRRESHDSEVIAGHLKKAIGELERESDPLMIGLLLGRIETLLGNQAGVIDETTRQRLLRVQVLLKPTPPIDALDRIRRAFEENRVGDSTSKNAFTMLETELKRRGIPTTTANSLSAVLEELDRERITALEAIAADLFPHQPAEPRVNHALKALEAEVARRRPVPDDVVELLRSVLAERDSNRARTSLWYVRDAGSLPSAAQTELSHLLVEIQPGLTPKVDEALKHLRDLIHLNKPLASRLKGDFGTIEDRLMLQPLIPESVAKIVDDLVDELNKPRHPAVDPKEVVTAVQEWKELSRGPASHYEYGCSYASMGEIDDAATEFDQAIVDGSLAEWMHDDPQLAVFRKSSPQYREKFGPRPRTELLDLAPFKPMRSGLEAPGMARASAWLHATEAWLARTIPTTDVQALAMHDLACLVVSLETDRMLKPLAIEIAAQLIDGDLASRSLIKAAASHWTEVDRREWSRQLAEATIKFARAPETTCDALETAIDEWVTLVCSK